MMGRGRRYRGGGALAIALLGALPGCGGDDLESRYSVSGKVTRQGQPSPKGVINFRPTKADTGRVASGEIQPDGSYNLTTKQPGDGAMVGEYLVTINMVDVDDSKVGKMPSGKPRLDQLGKVRVKALVPPKYSDPSKTELKAKVEPRSNTFDFDIKEWTCPTAVISVMGARARRIRFSTKPDRGNARCPDLDSASPRSLPSWDSPHGPWAGSAWWREPSMAGRARRAILAGRHDEADAALTPLARVRSRRDGGPCPEGARRVGDGPDTRGRRSLEARPTAGFKRSRGPTLLRALILARVGRHAEAEPALRRAFSGARVPDRQVDEALAKVYIETFDLTRARVVLDRWSRDFPDDPKPFVWRAEVRGRTEEGASPVMDDYREALRRDPSLARARLGLAEELRKAHRNVEAATEYDAYLASRPDDPGAHLGAGQNRMELGDQPAADRHLDRSIALDPKNPEPHKVIAEAAVRRGDWPAAMALLDRAMALDPADLGVRYRRGLVLKRLGRDEEARAEQAVANNLRDDLARLDRAKSRLIESPHDRKIQLEIARWMFDHSHEEEGARWAEQILREHPNDPEASGLLADFHQRRGDPGLANYYRLQTSTGTRPGESGRPR